MPDDTTWLDPAEFDGHGSLIGFDLGRDECFECAEQEGHAAGCSANIPAKMATRAEPASVKLALTTAGGGFYPSINDALGYLDAYAWHPLYDFATDAVEAAFRRHGGVEACARATELRDMFDAMCGATPGVWG